MFAPQRLDAARETRPARAHAPALPEGADAPPAAVPGGRPTALHFISDHVAASLVHEPPKPWRRDGIGAEGGSAGFHLGFWRSPGTAGRPQDTRGLLSHDVTVAGDATAPRAGCRHPEPRYNPTFASHDVRWCEGALAVALDCTVHGNPHSTVTTPRQLLCYPCTAHYTPRRPHKDATRATGARVRE